MKEGGIRLETAMFNIVVSDLDRLSVDKIFHSIQREQMSRGEIVIVPSQSWGGAGKLKHTGVPALHVKALEAAGIKYKVVR